jgi:hypothetical protein
MLEDRILPFVGMKSMALVLGDFAGHFADPQNVLQFGHFWIMEHVAECGVVRRNSPSMAPFRWFCYAF